MSTEEIDILTGAIIIFIFTLVGFLGYKLKKKYPKIADDEDDYWEKPWDDSSDEDTEYALWAGGYFSGAGIRRDDD